MTGALEQTGASGGHRYAWRVFGVTSIGAALSGINTSTMDVALPVVSRHFGSSATEASWTVLSYLLVNTALILVFGRVADLVGRRRLYLLGLATLSLAGLACGLAPDAGWLIACRAAQAVGAAALLCNITALLTDAFAGPLLSTALGLNVSIAAGAQVLGPVLGGGLVALFGWRAVFWFNVPIGALGLLRARSTLRPDPAVSARERFDVLGAALSTLALGGLVLALSEGGALGWTSRPVLVGTALVTVLAPLFVVTERRRPAPMLDLRLFADRDRSLAYVALLLMAVARFAVVLLVALYLQAAAGLSAFRAGLQVVPLALGMALVSPLAGRLARRYSARLLSSGGMLLSAAGLLGLAALVAPGMDRWLLALCLLAVGAGTGMFMTPNTSAIMASVGAGQRGVANGLRQGMQNAGYVVSTALALAIVTMPLPAADKRAAYAGRLAALSPHLLGAFTGGCRVALLVLAGACLVGTACSLSRRARAPRPAAVAAG